MVKTVKACALFLPELKQLLAEKDLATLKNVLREINPVDLAEGWQELSRDEQATLFQLLGVRKSVVVFEELQMGDQVFLLNAMSSEAANQMVQDLPPGEVAHLLRKLPPRVVKRLSNLVRRQEAVQRIEQTQAYPRNAVGSLMHTEVVRLRESMTASQALELIRAVTRTHVHEQGILTNLYVVDGRGQLLGFVPLQTLVAAPHDSRIKELMMPAHMISVQAASDQEAAAALVTKYNLLSAPVVDEEERLVGVLLIDDVLDIVQKEASEDIAKMAGTAPEEFTARSVLGIIRLRLPWLLAAVAGGFLVSMVIKRFQGTIREVVAVAAFMPMIAAMGGNVGAQSATVIVRSLAMGRMQIKEWYKAMMREFAVGFLMGAGYGLVVGGFAYLLYGKELTWQFGMVVSLGMLVSMTVAATVGAVGPFIFERVGIDPATATGPLITTTTDLIATTAYLALATVVLM